MKRRVRKIANFFAFNLLFFALYLNFIHKDRVAVANADQPNLTKSAAFSGTVLVDNPEQFMQKRNDAAVTVSAQQTSAKSQTEETALKLSIN